MGSPRVAERVLFSVSQRSSAGLGDGNLVGYCPECVGRELFGRIRRVVMFQEISFASRRERLLNVSRAGQRGEARAGPIWLDSDWTKVSVFLQYERHV